MIAPFLFQLVLVGLIVYGIVRLARGRSAAATSAEAMRRFFEYVLLLILVGVVGAGVGGLLEAVLAGSDQLARTDEPALARSLAFLVVGAPALAWLGRRAYRRLRDSAAERATFGWAAYVTVAQAGALVTAMVGAAGVLRWVLGEADYRAESLALAIVWGLVWAAHWGAGRRLAEPARLRVSRLFGSAVGLITAAVAAAYGLGSLLATIYDEAFRSVLAATPADELRLALAWLAVGALVWWWHWYRAERGAAPTDVWRAYVLLIGVLGGVLTAAIALGTAAFVALQWAIGEPNAGGTADHFAPVAATLAAFAVGSAVWAYHRAVLSPLRHDRTELDRGYGYLLAAVGLLGAATGLTVVVVAMIDALLPASGDLLESEAGDVLAGGLAMLLVGGPIWARQWWRAERHAAADAAGERGSGTRRTYLYAVIGLAGLAALIGLIGALVVGIEAALEGTFGTDTIREANAALATLFVVGAVAGFHARVAARDRVLAPAPARPAVRDVLLVSADGADLAAALAAELGVQVRTLRRVDAAPAPLAVEDVVAALRAETHEHVVLLTAPDGSYEVVPVADRA